MRATELAVEATMDRVGTPTLGGEPLSVEQKKKLFLIVSSYEAAVSHHQIRVLINWARRESRIIRMLWSSQGQLCPQVSTMWNCPGERPVPNAFIGLSSDTYSNTIPKLP